MPVQKKTRIACLVFVCLLCSSNGYAALYKADPVYSSVTFKVKELTGYVVGLFNVFGAAIELNEDNTKIVALKAIVDVRSVYTRNNQRDRDMMGSELFDAGKFPQAQFSSKKIEGNKITGDLTLKGKTREVVLEYTLGKVAQDQWGRTTVPLTAKGIINRKDFGILYNRKLDTGGFLIDDKVNLDIAINGILKQ